MMRYHYEIIHVPGKELNTADYLSHSQLQEIGSTNELQEEVQVYVNHIVKYLPASNKRLIQIWEHQIKDPILCSRKDQVLGGGKRRKNKIKSYADLSVKDRLLMKGDSIVIPKDLQEETLEQLHTGHQGIVKDFSLVA